MYISVSDAAAKYNISKRRVQTLCEQGRIEGAKMISGIWLIPQNAPKPTDARKKSKQKNEKPTEYERLDENLTLNQVCDVLSVSKATAQNWIRLGKLVPSNENLVFGKEYIFSLKEQILSGENPALKSRRNKRQISGTSVYKEYISNAENIAIVESIINAGHTFNEEELRLLLSNFAVQLYYHSRKIEFENGNVIFDFMDTQSKSSVIYTLITDLLGTADICKDKFSHLSYCLNLKLNSVSHEDTLGFVYISLRDLGQRKISGAYYTPQKTVDSLIHSLIELRSLKNLSILDPCCGTGNFLIELLNRGIPANRLFGQDIDKISVLLTRINIFLLSQTVDLDFLYSNFICGNSLKNPFPEKFDIVLGNPPWGSNFSDEDIKFFTDNYTVIQGKNIESYDLFIEKSLSLINRNGVLAFVLPESILNVSTHTAVRKLILQKCAFKFVNFLGNAFSGVQCPSIILGISLEQNGNKGSCKVSMPGKSYLIDGARVSDETCFSFNISDEENECIQAICSIQNAVYLKNNARFALGIVTGNNKESITNKKTSTNDMVLKGSNIFRYNVQPSENYITYKPENFQQVAPTEIYRAPEKLLYRFICETPVFAYDDKQTLSLNSCNIVIPQIEGLSMKYVLAILNSSVVAFFITKKFNSIKLLRSHIEQIPIPFVSPSTQCDIEKKVTQLLKDPKNRKKIYCELDEMIINLYKLNNYQRQTILSSFERSKFLLQ